MISRIELALARYNLRILEEKMNLGTATEADSVTHDSIRRYARKLLSKPRRAMM